MTYFFCRKHISFCRKGISAVVVLCFSLFAVVGPAGSQTISLPNFGLTTPFQPPVLRGMTVHLENPLLFDFIVDRGQEKIANDLLKDESTKLIKYFLTSMTIPDKDAWVNLSPYEKDRIIPDALGQTEMGRQMLEQDYVLKQLAASLTNPDTQLGKKYWDEVHRLERLDVRRLTLEKTTSVQPPASSDFNKVWIVPDGATVVEKDGFAYITESKLTVMLDEDYGSQNLSSPHALSGDPLRKIDSRFRGNDIEKLSTQVFRQLILPKLIEEVNTGKNFAATRQVYQSVILAAWYKRALKDSLLGRIYADKSKVAGVESDVPDIKQKVYEQYLEAFKKGAYNVIKEEDGPDGESIPRKYFSGGEVMSFSSSPLTVLEDQGHQLARTAIRELPPEQIFLVAASTVENFAEEQATIAASALTLERPNDSRIAELLKLSPRDPSLEDPRLEESELGVILRPIDDKTSDARFVGQQLDQLTKSDPDKSYEILQIGVGRGVAAIQYALRYPSIRITAVNRFADEWGWESAIVHAVHEENLRRNAAGQMQITFQEVKNAISRVEVVAMDIQNEDNRKELLADKKFDGIFFEPFVQLYFKDNIRTIEKLFNERVALNGFMVFDIDPHPQGYDWNLRDPNNRKIELDPTDVVRSAFSMVFNSVVNVDRAGRIFALSRSNLQDIRIPIKQSNGQDGTASRAYTRLPTKISTYVMDTAASSTIKNVNSPENIAQELVEALKEFGATEQLPDVVALFRRKATNADSWRRYFFESFGVNTKYPKLAQAFTQVSNAHAGIYDIFENEDGQFARILEIATGLIANVPSSPSVKQPAAPGGIDFDSSKLNLQIKRDARGVPLPLPEQDLENININGLTPVILRILPVNAQTLPILGQLQISPDSVLSKG